MIQQWVPCCWPNMLRNPQKSTALTEIHRFERSHPRIPSSKHTKNCGKSPLFMGKPSTNGQCSMAMLNNQRVYPMKDSHENWPIVLCDLPKLVVFQFALLDFPEGIPWKIQKNSFIIMVQYVPHHVPHHVPKFSQISFHFTMKILNWTHPMKGRCVYIYIYSAP